MLAEGIHRAAFDGFQYFGFDFDISSNIELHHQAYDSIVGMEVLKMTQ